jgi:hypothetical protein
LEAAHGCIKGAVSSDVLLADLVSAPLLRHLVKRGVMLAGLWGRPVVVFGAGEIGARLVRAPQDEWGLG